METLMDLYNSVQSPLEDLDKVKKQSTDVGENYLYTSRIQKHFIRY